jgi:hypothetical protein
LIPVNFISAPDQGDAEAVVLGAELHPEVVAVVLVTTIGEKLVAEGFFDPKDPKLKIEDDVGTVYRRAFQVGIVNEWSGSHGVRRPILEFEPPVPPDATYLRITLGSRGTVALMV